MVGAVAVVVLEQLWCLLAERGCAGGRDAKALHSILPAQLVLSDETSTAEFWGGDPGELYWGRQGSMLGSSPPLPPAARAGCLAMLLRNR